MEVTDDVKQQFMKQASEVDVRFLIRALDLVERGRHSLQRKQSSTTASWS
jgi:hypothetical protein